MQGANIPGHGDLPGGVFRANSRIADVEWQRRVFVRYSHYRATALPRFDTGDPVATHVGDSTDPDPDTDSVDYAKFDIAHRNAQPCSDACAHRHSKSNAGTTDRGSLADAEPYAHSRAFSDTYPNGSADADA